MFYPKEKQLNKTIIDYREFNEIANDESALQRQAEEYLDLLKIPYMRFPDSGYFILFGSNSKLSDQNKRFLSKYLKGLPDLTLLKKVNDKYCLACRIELKTKNGKLSQGQKNRSKNLRSEEHTS